MGAPPGLDHCPLMPTYGAAAGAVRPGRGHRLWDRDGNALPRLPLRPRRHRRSATPTPRSPTRCAEQARTLLHVSNLFGTEPGRRGRHHPRPPPRRRRPGVLLQLRRRGQRVRHQAGPQVGRPRAATSWSAPSARSTAAPWPRCTPPASPQKHEAFQPLPEGFRHVAWNDLDALEARHRPVGRRRAARAGAGRGRREPGHRRVLPGRPPAVRRARPAVHGRRGADRPRPHRASGSATSTSACVPDVVTMAKALGNGVPIGACWARRDVAAAFEPGDHATTYGGQPLATAAARAVLAVMEREDVPGSGRRTPARGCTALLAGRARRGRGAGPRPAARRRARAEGIDARRVAADALAAGLVVNAVTPDRAAAAPRRCSSPTTRSTRRVAILGRRAHRRAARRRPTP